jgi:hypothetical protein
MKVMIIVKLEISDHDGYCSDNECIYKSMNRRYMRNIPDENINKQLDDPYWTSLLPEPTINYSVSGYCELSKECSEHYLGHHEYKYTVKKNIFYN